jgi:hypothetical protein
MSTPNFVHFDDQTIQADGLALTKSESPSSFSESANNECLDSAKMTDSLILRIIKSLPQSTPPPKPRRSFIIEASDVVELLEQDRAPSVIATEDCSSSSGIASGSGGVSDIEQLVIKAPTAAACAKKKGSDASNLSCFSDISSIYYSATDSSSIVGSVGCSSNGAIKITDADIDEPEGKHQFDENDGNESDYEDDEDQTIREDAATIIVDDDESFFTRPDVTVVARYGFNVGRSRSVIRSVIDDGHKSATRNLPRTTAAARWMSSGIVARLGSP